MKRIDEENLEKVKGGEGASAVLIGIAVAAALVFISGIIEGITNPERCNG